jgi:hypothetical protein
LSEKFPAKMKIGTWWWPSTAVMMCCSRILNEMAGKFKQWRENKKWRENFKNGGKIKKWQKFQMRGQTVFKHIGMYKYTYKKLVID